MQFYVDDWKSELLLLARGACIETPPENAGTSPPQSCSSQEEHVLKLMEVGNDKRGEKLLLARGACIETFTARKARAELSCSSQEEHVLKLTGLGGNDNSESCSSQEEHVLKLRYDTRIHAVAFVAPRKRSMY